MDSLDIKTRDMIHLKLNEGILSYCEYDGSGRLLKVIEAPIHAKNGDPCLVTELKYNGTTTSVRASKESIGVWNSANHFDVLA